MSGGSENEGLAALEELLTSWHVGILYEMFKEEDITIHELKMMQFNHIYELLKDYKMGVRIRFDYYFSNWRKKIGLPLKHVELNHNQAYCYCKHKANSGNSCFENRNVQNKTTNNNGNNETKKRKLNGNVLAVEQTDIDETQPPLSSQSINSNHSFVNMLTSNEFVPVPVVGSPNCKTHNTDEEVVDMENLPLNTLSEISSESAYEKPPKFPSKPSSEKCPFTLKQILQMSGSRGMSIVKFFKERKHLTNICRSQLIRTIVEIFVENHCHMTLNMSHILEWEIVKMFPTEKLEYYRTGKRGKIYVKFCHTKGYKRKRSVKVKSEMNTVALRSLRSGHSQQINGTNNEAGNLLKDHTKNVERRNSEDWSAEPEITVKEENISDNDQNIE